MAVSTKGLRVTLAKGGVASTELVLTAVSSATPAVVTVASVTGITKGDVVKIDGSGFRELDGQVFTVGTVTAASNTFELVGSNTTGTTGTLGATPKAHVTKAADMTLLCLASIDFSATEGSTISTGTFCDPSSSIAVPPSSAGTLSMSGFIDVGDAGYKELLAAEIDGKARVLSIELPQNQGHIVANCVVSSLSFQTPLEGAVGFQASGSLTTRPRHVF